MSLLNRLRRAARTIGLEVHRYNPAQSLDARFFALLARHRVDLVLDVGANDGGYGGYLRDGGYAGPIVSFEPLQQAHAALSARAARDGRWRVAPRGALGEAAGSVEIHVAGNSKSSSLLPMMDTHRDAAPYSATVGQQTVTVSRLDDVALPELDAASRALLKIDTQGYEMPVLRGAAATLPRCVGVQLEMSLLPLYEGQVLYRELIDWLDAAGFELWGLLPGFTDPRSGRLLQMDGLFFRPEPRVAAR